MENLTPDHIEEGLGPDLDNVVPTFGYQLLPVVGLGGSAGALPALRAFFQSLPPHPGVAFVVVMHLSPDHESMLADLIQEATPMRVVKVQNTEKVKADTVYVIPPGKLLRSMDGHISLADMPVERYKHVAVDLFFRTLADTHGPHATAIVLSGADGDGAIGIKRIKERGGLTIVQDPDEALHDGMPRSAIDTGMVDWVLPVAEMAQRVLAYCQLEHDLKLPPEHTVQESVEAADEEESYEADLRDVLAFLRSRTGRNFSYYKRATILRRIGRRMQVNGVDDLRGYLEILRTRPGESGALLQDLLISVTNFFRDTECFDALKARVPSLFEGKGPSDTVRVWVVACATGEEAYSVAMLLTEHARTLDAPPLIQVFATDLDEEAIRVARDGIYPPTIQADVDEDRLRRFFIKEHQGMRVRRELREMVLFAVHDVLKDSPFSRLDMVTCRNLMIYLTRPAQARVLETFHFAMYPEALLFLGSSESVDEAMPQFTVLDKKHRLFQQRPLFRSGLPVPEGPGTLALSMDSRYMSRPGPVIPGLAFVPPAAPRASAVLEGRAASWGDMHLKLVEQLAPPSLLVDAEYDLLHISPKAGQLLQFGGGEPSRNLLRAIHPSLRIELRAALFKAAQSAQVVEVVPLSVDTGAGPVLVTIRVAPAEVLAPGLLLVFLHTVPVDAEGSPTDAVATHVSDPAAHHLDRELERLKSHLRDTVEQYEASNEELKASNEELQAMNEELRSATEELETSREELQSINEELSTVNQELKSKVDQLGSANSDMHNLMDATAIATVFLDRDLAITRYTPSAVSLFRLIPTDVGRPLSDLQRHIDYPELDSDAREVLAQLVPVEREVGREGGPWFMACARPYRTLEDRIAGVVITFVDITERKHDQEKLRASEALYSAIVTEATVGVVQTALDGRITFANRCYQSLLGFSESDLLGMPLLERVHPADRARSAALFGTLARTGESFQVEKRCLRKDGSLIWLHNSVNALKDSSGRPASALVVCHDITERKTAVDALRGSEERLRLMIENALEYAIFSTDRQRRITSWNAGAERLLGFTEEEAVGKLCDVLFIEADQAAGVPAREAQFALAGKRSAQERWHQRKDGSRFWASGAMMAMHDRNGETVGFVKILRDQSEERASRRALEDSQSELLLALQDKETARAALEESDAGKDRFLAVLSHELRNPLASINSAGDVLVKARLTDDLRTQAAQVVRRQAHTMKVLLDDLLDMSRLRLGKLELRRVPVEARTVMESAVEAVMPLMEAATHRLDVALAPLGTVVDADPVRLSQVLSNLLGNAAKYTPNGGRIALSARVEEDEVLFVVEDDGMGMEPETVESMFQMFRQAPVEGAGHGLRGMGVGLALVRSLVGLHGGQVHGESAGLGQGSRFTVAIPLHANAAGAVASSPSQPDVAVAVPVAPVQVQAQDTTAPMRILIADDNADAAWSLSQLLEIDGHEVFVAHNGKQALELAQREQPEVIVLDIGMPDIEGYEVARRIRAEAWGGRMLLIAATGWGNESDRTKSAAAGFDVHLVKPVDYAELQKVIDGHIPER